MILFIVFLTNIDLIIDCTALCYLSFILSNFKDIPWQNTGKPITMDSEEVLVANKLKKVKRYIMSLIKDTPFLNLSYMNSIRKILFINKVMLNIHLG
ncbi:hypothetical protein TUM17384_14570 [Shewanella algae]|nr:hypothetical protein TUM17384_14570 [Shewanella algae]